MTRSVDSSANQASEPDHERASLKPSALPVTAEQVEQAARILDGVARITPIQEIERLSEGVGLKVIVKREDLQRCRSFKMRGAYNRIARIPESERSRGVVCASAGNHAQGVALACAELGIHGTIYLPSSTPRQKRDRIASLGGDWVRMVFIDGTFDEAQMEAQKYAEQTHAIYVHPFDDPAVIAGQGSIAKEISNQLGSDLGTVIIPIGGGGLISGMAAWLKQNRPNVKIIGAEPLGAPSMTAALKSGEPVTLGSIDGFVDGTAVKRAGDTTYQIVKQLVDQVVLVPEGAVSREMLELYHTDGIIAEPAGALATAVVAMIANGELTDVELNGTTVALISGGNNDLSRYPEMQERSLVYQGLRHYFLVSFPQRPGALREFLDGILGPNDDILYFEYTKKNNRETGPALVGIDIHAREDLPGLLERMESSDLQIEHLDAESELLSFLV